MLKTFEDLNDRKKWDTAGCRYQKHFQFNGKHIAFHCDYCGGEPVADSFEVLDRDLKAIPGCDVKSGFSPSGIPKSFRLFLVGGDWNMTLIFSYIGTNHPT